MGGRSALPLEALPRWEAPPPEAESLYREALAGFSRKIVVLDDDPTGIQTVHGVNVYTSWDRESVLACFRDEAPAAFLLTNSRSFSEARTREVHREIGETIAWAAGKTGRRFTLVSRGDSTLRGHWPAETQVLAETLTQAGERPPDGEILIPFFLEGGRFTFGGVHYVREGNTLVPAGETEFARDPVFGYASSDLALWCQERTRGAYRAEDCVRIALEDMRALRVEEIARKLAAAEGFAKIIVDAVCYEDLQVFFAAYCRALRAGKEFLFRTAASWVRVLAGISARPLLTRAELASGGGSGGIIVAGSYVKKTTAQLEHLRNSGLGVRFLEFRVERAAEQGGLEEEAAWIASEAEELLSRGITAAVYTSRRFAVPGADSGVEQTQADISRSLAGVVGRLRVRPSFIVAKGGITSSDVGVKALGVKRAAVMGQAAPGVPVWMTGPESKFPHMPYVIFPGNVGDDGTLTAVVGTLMGPRDGGGGTPERI